MKQIMLIFLMLSFATFRAYAQPAGASCANLLRQEIPISAQATDFTCGVACFHSVLRYWKIGSPGQYQLAHLLGTWVNRQTYSHLIVRGAHYYGLYAQEKTQVSVDELRSYLARGETVIVSWFIEGMGHYSVVSGLSTTHISLMDPWYARLHPLAYNTMTLEEFLPVFNGPRTIGHIIRISPRPLMP